MHIMSDWNRNEQWSCNSFDGSAVRETGSTPRISNGTTLACLGALVALGAAPEVFAACAADDSAGVLASDAYYLPTSAAPSLQKALDDHGIVKLAPAGDYTRAAVITLKSGQKILGMAGTKLSRVIVQGGTTGATLRGLSIKTLEFPASSFATKSNCFERLTGRIEVNGASLENNEFIDLSFTKLSIDNHASGYMRNNRFVRVMMYSLYPSLRMDGNTATPSYGNIFIAANVLAPHGGAVLLNNQKDLTFVGINAESWNFKKKSANRYLVTARGIDELRIFGLVAGDWGPNKGPLMDLDVGRTTIMGLRAVGPVEDRPILMRRDSSKATIMSIVGLPPGRLLKTQSAETASATVASSSGRPQFINGAGEVRELTNVETEEFVREFQSAESGAATRQAFPALEPLNTSTLPRPFGSTDASDRIQAMIDSDGIAKLAPGIYFISKPLKLNRGHGIIGSGRSRTVIAATSGGIDMIVGDEHLLKPASTTFVLADLTLQGGRNGIHHSSGTSGMGAQYVNAYISNVTFRDMTAAAIFVDGIYGWDNNFIERTYFLNNGVAFKQRVHSSYVSPEVSGDVAGMSYLDKNVFYKCRFENNGTAISWLAKRWNTTNYFVNSLFRGNRDMTLEQRQVVGTFFINSVVDGNGGSPTVVSEREVGFVNTELGAGRNGPLLGSPVLCEGCIFKAAGFTSAVLGERNAILVNSSSTDMKLGNVRSALLLNSRFPGDPILSSLGALLSGSGLTELLSGSAAPQAQLLSSP